MALKFMPGMGYIDTALLPDFPKPEDGEMFVLTDDSAPRGYASALSLDRGHVYDMGAIGSIRAPKGRNNVVGFRGNIARFDAAAGGLVETDQRVAPDAKVKVYKPSDNSVDEVVFANFLRDKVKRSGNDRNYIAEWVHLPTELEGFDQGVVDDLIARVEAKCKWLPFEVRVIGASRRFILYWSDSNSPGQGQKSYLTLAPRGRDPFNEDWKISKRFLDQYPPERVAKKEVPPPAWAQGATAISHLIYRGHAWYLRLLLNGKDAMSGCRVFVKDDTDFIVSDQCQRGDRKSADGINMQYGNQWAIDTWLLTYAIHKLGEDHIPGIGKFKPTTKNLGEIEKTDRDRMMGIARKLREVEITLTGEKSSAAMFGGAEAEEAVALYKPEYDPETGMVKLSYNGTPYIGGVGGENSGVPDQTAYWRWGGAMEDKWDGKPDLFDRLWVTTPRTGHLAQPSLRPMVLAIGHAYEKAGRHFEAERLAKNAGLTGLFNDPKLKDPKRYIMELAGQQLPGEATP